MHFLFYIGWGCEPVLTEWVKGGQVYAYARVCACYCVKSDLLREYGISTGVCHFMVHNAEYKLFFRIFKLLHFSGWQKCQHKCCILGESQNGTKMYIQYISLTHFSELVFVSVCINMSLIRAVISHPWSLLERPRSITTAWRHTVYNVNSKTFTGAMEWK